LNVPVAGRYNISIRVSTTAPAKIWIGHSTFLLDTLYVPNTGGKWVTITDTLRLPALSYTGVHVLSGYPKFNWFSIDNCAKDPALTVMSTSKVEQPLEARDAQVPVIYPNPTNGQLTIDLRGFACKRVKLIDMSGNVLRQWNVGKGERQVSRDISTLPGGVYILMIEGEKETKTIQVIKI
jgi:hypothetical protein